MLRHFYLLFLFFMILGCDESRIPKLFSEGMTLLQSQQFERADSTFLHIVQDLPSSSFSDTLKREYLYNIAASFQNIKQVKYAIYYHIEAMKYSNYSMLQLLHSKLNIVSAYVANNQFDSARAVYDRIKPFPYNSMTDLH